MGGFFLGDFYRDREVRDSHRVLIARLSGGVEVSCDLRQDGVDIGGYGDAAAKDAVCGAVRAHLESSEEEEEGGEGECYKSGDEPLRRERQVGAAVHGSSSTTVPASMSCRARRSSSKSTGAAPMPRGTMLSGQRRARRSARGADR